MKTRTRTALIVTVMAGWLGGCGAEQPSAPATTSVPVRSAGLKIVMIAKNTTNPIFVSARKGAPNLRKRVEGVKKEAALHPGIQIVGTFNHAETAADAAAEVSSAQAANPQIQGWAMVGGWALSTPRLMKELDPKKVKVVAVNALPAQLPFVENGLAPVLLALPTYNWGYVSVQRIVDKVHLKQDVPTIIPPMEVVRVTKDNLGTWARQLQAWGSTVPDPYLKLK